MKNFIICAFAILIFSIGLLTTSLAFIGLIDPEGVDKMLVTIFISAAFISFSGSRFLWKLSRKSVNLP